MIVAAPFVYRASGADAVSCAAQATASALNAALVALGPGAALNPQLNLNAPVPPGVYSVPASADIATTTTSTLNGAGTYVFIIPVSITQNTLSNVSLIGGADPCDVFWSVGAAATLSGNSFPGTVIAGTGVTLNGAVNTVTVNGRVVSLTASVTMPGGFAKTIGGCSAAAAPALPDVAMWGLMGILLAGGVFVLTRH